MRDENAIVALRIELESVEEGRPAVVLDGERRVQLDPQDERTPGYLEVFRELRDQRRPVYVELDPDTGALARVLLPLPTRVVQIAERDGELLVELAGSHAIHRVDLGRDDADELVALLRGGGKSGWLLVTDDEAHQVIDVVEFTPGPEGPDVPPFPKTLEPRPLVLPWWPRWWGWFRRWFCWFCWWRCPSMATAQSIFDQLGATSCPPLTTPAPCIPFMYPDDGCWARAHEMCRLMLNMGRHPRKVWIRQGPQGPLVAQTKNNPFCQVVWGWHVAPTLCVRTGSKWWWPFYTERMVMDPSMFTTPVSTATWQAACTDPSSTLQDTVADQYWPSGGTDPTYSSTNADLATYRTALRNRSLSSYGPPPYSNC
jgi:hypothetical protein